MVPLDGPGLAANSSLQEEHYTAYLRERAKLSEEGDAPGGNL